MTKLKRKTSIPQKTQSENVSYRPEKITSKHIINKTVIYRVCNKFLQIHKKKTNNTKEKWAKTMNKQFMKKFKGPLNT